MEGLFALKKGGMSGILISENAAHIRHAVRSPFRPCVGEADNFYAPPTFYAEGGMLHDALGDFSSADAACNRRLWRVRYRMENLYTQKMTAP